MRTHSNLSIGPHCSSPSGVTFGGGLPRGGVGSGGGGVIVPMIIGTMFMSWVRCIMGNGHMGTLSSVNKQTRLKT